MFCSLFKIMYVKCVVAFSCYFPVSYTHLDVYKRQEEISNVVTPVL